MSAINQSFAKQILNLYEKVTSVSHLKFFIILKVYDIPNAQDKRAFFYIVYNKPNLLKGQYPDVQGFRHF